MKKILGLVLGLLFTLPAVASSVPADYTELEYIQSSGTQYIDTGFGDVNGLYFKIDAQYIGFNNGYNALAGIEMPRNVCIYAHDGKWWYGVGSVAGSTGANSDTQRHIFYTNTTVNAWIKIDGVEIYSETVELPRTDEHVKLFVSNMNNTFAEAKMYSAQLYDHNNTLVRNFIPAKNPSGVVGMYDTVSGTFFTNQGTGSFTAGPATCRNLFDENSFYNAVGPSYEIFPTSNENGRTYFLRVKPNTKYTISFKTPGDRLAVYSLNKEVDPRDYSTAHPLELGPTLYNNNAPTSPTVFTTREDSKMVAIYYSLSERPTEFQIEEGSTATAYEPYNAACWAIKVATKKYNDTAFSPVMTALNGAIATIKTVVTNTINQAAAVSALQTGKQTMPNASATNGTCPNYKQCLLVETSDGTPQWFVITDPVRDFMMPLFASGTNGNSSTYNAGYTQLEYIESTGTQWIDTGVGISDSISFEARVGTTAYNVLGITAYNGTGLLVWQSGNTFNFRYIATDNPSEYTIETDQTYSISTLYNIGFNINKSSFIFNGISTEKTKTIEPGGSIKTGTNDITAYLKIYDNGTLVRDMVPVIRNSDGAIGMYDKVNNTFYANVGSGTFTAGPIVDNDPGVPGMTWTATWTASGPITAGTVYGEAKCNAISPSTGNGDPATSAQLNSSGWNTEGINCWCRMTGISVNNQFTGAQSYGQWIDNRPFNNGIGNCRRSCADRCVSSFRYSADYRRSMVKM